MRKKQKNKKASLSSLSKGGQAKFVINKVEASDLLLPEENTFTAQLSGFADDLDAYIDQVLKS